MVVHFLDCAIVAVLQITSVSKTPFVVTDLIVDGVFRPTLAVANFTEWFSPLQWPKPMSYGSTFCAVLHAPALPRVTLASCCPKAPASLVISTRCGDFAFKAGKILRAEP